MQIVVGFNLDEPLVDYEDCKLKLSITIITTRKGSLRRLCFLQVSVHRGGVHGCWGCAWLLGGMHGCRGHAWLCGVMHGCVGGMQLLGAYMVVGACVVARVCVLGGHAWLWGVCMVAGGACMVAGGMHGCGGGMRRI